MIKMNKGNVDVYCDNCDEYMYTLQEIVVELDPTYKELCGACQAENEL